MRARIIATISVFCVLLLLFGSVGWMLLYGKSNVIDLAFCYTTLTNCTFGSSIVKTGLNMLLLSNAIAFGVWLFYLIAAHSFVVGVSAWRQVLGGIFAVLIPLLGFTLVTASIFFRTVRFG
ncbi:MAG: hypothetical protein A3I66_03560 [Burkholderiales bacterium RIFCSPLOWO2_02_FULL_57_36]|nr:MAG: hypothetical protein A3I66_03560 [Burkholderiales bacterium RIFCSPLOWO2_02_FULL_57_36]